MKVKNLLSMILVAGMMLVGCQNDGQDVDQYNGSIRYLFNLIGGYYNGD